MNEHWKQWEGLNLEGRFPLRQLLGATDHSAAFLTQLSQPESRNATIKFIPDNSLTAETRLKLWRQAAQFSHPNLIPVFECGRCRLGEQHVLYVVMEFAEENLGEILPQRPLTVEEARAVLDASLDVFGYLHGKGLAHGHLKPSNLLATPDSLKLSPDTILPIGTLGQSERRYDVYDAPEVQAERFTAKSDVWSLGALLLEALTQKTPVVPLERTSDPALPGGLPDPFREIIRGSLGRQAARRWSVPQIVSRLSAPAVVAAAPAPPVPLVSPEVSLSTEPPVPAAKALERKAPPPAAPRPAVQPASSKPARPDYLIPALLGVVVLIGVIFALPKAFNFPSQNSSSASPTATRSASAERAEAAPTERAAPPLQQPVESSSLKAAPVALRDSGAPAKTKTAAAHSQVLDQVLPQAPPKALATIQGTIRVAVKVNVDAAGNVTEAELDNAGPSKYFAGLSEKAARQWKFAGAESSGHGVPSAWLLRFEFSATGVHASSEQTSP